MKLNIASLIIVAGLTVLAGCKVEEAAIPEPHELTREISGHYCQMIVADHAGPKAQIFVHNQDRPLWFPSVRDAFAFIMLPGEAKTVSAFYVNDMAVAKNWESPEPGTWTDAYKAFFVIESDKKGGMNLNEVVPFSNQPAAQNFINRHKGKIVKFGDVTVDYIFADPTETAEMTQESKNNTGINIIKEQIQ